MAEYISKTDLVSTLKDEAKRIKDDSINLRDPDERVWAVATKVGVDIAAAIVERYPSADVAPVQQGKWLPLFDANEIGDAIQVGCMCSVCGKDPPIESNYCPHCGAKMEE